MTGVTIFRGPAHVIEYQSDLFVQLMGPLMGLPAREALCDRGRYLPLLRLLDVVYATGVSMRARTSHGFLWILRLNDGSGVGCHYEREPALLPLELLPVQGQLALAR